MLVYLDCDIKHKTAFYFFAFVFTDNLLLLWLVFPFLDIGSHAPVSGIFT